MLDIFYYYYYWFYTKVLPDDEPFATTLFTLSFSISLAVNFVINLVSISTYCYMLSKWQMIGVMGITMLIVYVTYHRTGRARSIVEEPAPHLLGSNSLAAAVTILFFMITLSLLFISPIFYKHLLTLCD